MRKMFWLIPCLVLYYASTSSLWAAQTDLAVADWSVNSPHTLATNPPPDSSVLAFLNKLDAINFYSGICSSRFADLRHAGNLSLVVSASDGRFCHLSIIDKTASGFELYAVDLARYSDGPEIEDLDGDGNLELIVDMDFTEWRGLNSGPCVATWPVIYAWTGSGYTDVSSQYKRYYEQKLASLKKEIAAISSAAEPEKASATSSSSENKPAVMETNPRSMVPVMGTLSSSSNTLPIAPYARPVPDAASSPAATPATTPDLANADCTEAEAAKIERFLGISRDAGMSDAIKWANSNDPNKREFAVYVLQDIGTPDAIEYLRTLSYDTDKTVATIAQRTFLHVKDGRSLNTVDREEVEQPLDESLPK
jgi:hypothetical protein